MRLWVLLPAMPEKALLWVRLVEGSSERSAGGSKAGNNKLTNSKPHSNSNKRNGKSINVHLRPVWRREDIA